MFWCYLWFNSNFHMNLRFHAVFLHLFGWEQLKKNDRIFSRVAYKQRWLCGYFVIFLLSFFCFFVFLGIMVLLHPCMQVCAWHCMCATGYCCCMQHGYYPCCVKTLKGSQSTDPNQWPSLMLSVTVLLKRVLLPLHRLYDTAIRTSILILEINMNELR